MKRTTRTIVIIGLTLASCRGPVYAPTATPYTLSVRMLATTSTYPLLHDLASGYTRPGLLLVVDSAAANWETIYQALQAGTVPFALTTYLPPDTHLWAAPIGQDGIAIIVHVTNLVPALTTADLRLIFQGRITSWSEVGGPEMPITVISRETGADTRLVFQTLVMRDQPITLAAQLALSGSSTVDLVASIPGAVGYVSMSQVDDRVRMVPVAARAGATPRLPTPQTVSAETYLLRTPILVVGSTPPDDASIYRDWFAWMQGESGQRIVGQRYGTRP